MKQLHHRAMLLAAACWVSWCCATAAGAAAGFPEDCSGERKMVCMCTSSSGPRSGVCVGCTAAIMPPSQHNMPSQKGCRVCACVLHRSLQARPHRLQLDAVRAPKRVGLCCARRHVGPAPLRPHQQADAVQGLVLRRRLAQPRGAQGHTGLVRGWKGGLWAALAEVLKAPAAVAPAERCPLQVYASSSEYSCSKACMHGTSRGG